MTDLSSRAFGSQLEADMWTASSRERNTLHQLINEGKRCIHTAPYEGGAPEAEAEHGLASGTRSLVLSRTVIREQ
jgi:hypothetical protein